MGDNNKVVELYSREDEDNSIDDVEWAHYVAKLKEHEANKTSTNERNRYWDEHRRSKETSRDK